MLLNGSQRQAVISLTDTWDQVRSRPPARLVLGAGKRTWAAPIPASGTYRVDVVRKAPFCDPPLTYLLTITAR